MHSLSPEYLAKLRFDTKQLATLRALGEYRGKQQPFVAQSPEVLRDLRQVAVVESTESSNRLEGVVVAAHRLKSLVLKNATPQSRSEQEVAWYRDALGLIDPRKRRADAVFRGHRPSTPRHFVPLYAAAWRALESHQ